jgi:methylated-DNA-[protein]-cysteine S-methyltransferase
MEIRHNYQSPVGTIEIRADESAVTGICFNPEEETPENGVPTPLIGEACRQLDEYFAGIRRTFTLPLSLRGTDFQRHVWDALQRIPYGQTISYAQLAKTIGQPKACRAVGAANGRNPVAIVVPCHRVVASNGSLGGYAYGLKIKQQLLDGERAILRTGAIC